jgi:hypothetical protein
MAQAIEASTTSRFHNLSTDALGHADAVLKGAEAERKALKDEIKRGGKDGDDLDKLEGSDLDISGEADGDNGGIVDDEPSLGSLDGRMCQLGRGVPDRPVFWPNQDFEHDEAEFKDGAD